MKTKRLHPTVVVAAALALMLPIVLLGGLYVRSIVLTTLDGLDGIRTARVSASTALTVQLDEETGIRGYAAAHDVTLLAPYQAGLITFDSDLMEVRDALDGLGLQSHDADVDALAAINQQWRANVAEPTLHNAGSYARQRVGKKYVDEYREHINDVVDAIDDRRVEISNAALLGVTRISIFSVLATLVVILAALALGVQQRAMQRRIDEERARALEAQAEYLAEKRVSDTLQEAFMLKPLPHVATVQLSGIYVPATEETRVGGDWYDAIELESGRVLLAIGDVAGHGLEAAVAMNRTRQAMLASALAGSDPAAVLTRVNAELIADDARMVTAVCGYADAVNCAFTFAAAGHPPPILIEPGGEPEILAFGGMPLAVMSGAPYASQTVQTRPGAMLVLYTDGAIEHSRDLFAGEIILKDAVAAAFRSRSSDPAGDIRESIFRSREIADDVAIVTLTFAADTGEPHPDTESMHLSVAGPEAGPGAVVSKATIGDP